MKAMRNMNMNRMLGSLKRRPNEASDDGSVDMTQDTPEANAARSVRLFCESAGPGGSGEEVLYLPVIVESAESSPTAAKECAIAIRKFLSKDNFSKPYVQYNSIMLIRILSDNPGKTFTRNIDIKFVQTVKELLRLGRDPSVKQILMETLDSLQREKSDDESLVALIEMWKKEQEKMGKLYGPPGAPRTLNAPPFDPNSQNYFSRNHHSRRLPNPPELSSRIEEARTSAKLLSQVVQSTPPSEVIQNELVREFADRCQSASRSIQAYMIAENPAPDNDTMETLIETNDQLAKALSQHQRAILQARKVTGQGPDEGRVSPSVSANGSFAATPTAPPEQSKPPVPARKAVFSVFSSKPKKGGAKHGDANNDPSEVSDETNPFNDPEQLSSSVTMHNPPFPKDTRPTATGQFEDRLGIEPFHPGFNNSKSYTGRQDSAVDRVTMHAAVPVTPNEEEEEEEEEGMSGRAGYNVSPGTKAPLYRY